MVQRSASFTSSRSSRRSREAADSAKRSTVLRDFSRRRGSGPRSSCPSTTRRAKTRRRSNPSVRRSTSPSGHEAKPSDSGVSSPLWATRSRRQTSFLSRAKSTSLVRPFTVRRVPTIPTTPDDTRASPLRHWRRFLQSPATLPFCCTRTIGIPRSRLFICALALPATSDTSV
jgi:hypothetical protein